MATPWVVDATLSPVDCSAADLSGPSMPSFSSVRLAERPMRLKRRAAALPIPAAVSTGLVTRWYAPFPMPTTESTAAPAATATLSISLSCAIASISWMRICASELLRGWKVPNSDWIVYVLKRPSFVTFSSTR